MATEIGIKFIKKSYENIESAISAATSGAIVFDSNSKTIFVDGVAYCGTYNVTDATYADNKLTITKVTGDPIELDFSDLASASAVMDVFKQISEKLGTLTASPVYPTEGLDENTVKAYTDNAVVDSESFGSAINKIDNKVKTTVEEIISNEEVTAGIFNDVKETVGMNDDYSITFTNDLIKDQTTVKGAIEKLASDAGNVDDVKIGGTSVLNSDKEAIIAVDGTYNPETNKIATMSSINNAIKLNETAGAYIPEDETELFDEDVVQSLNSDNKLTTDDTVAEAIEKLDKKGKTIFNEIITNEGIVNNTFGQVQKSTGLNDYFEYIPDTTTAYINDAQSLKEADKKLDDAIKAIAQKQIDVADGEKILSVDDNNAVSSTLTIDIEKDGDNKEYIVLKGIDNAEVSKVDASAFVKDGMITSVAWKEGSENVLVITWNDDSGKNPTTTEVDMSKFIDTYTSGNETALTVNGYVITPNTGVVAENAGTLTTGGQVYTAIAATKGQDIQTITGETAIVDSDKTLVNVAVTTTKGESDDNYTVASTVSVTTQDVSSATESADGIATAKDVKDYVDGAVSGSVKTIKIGDDDYTVSDNTSEVTLTSLSVSPDYNTESIDVATATALNVTNKISDTDNYAEGITKLDNKAKVIVDEIIKNEKVTATLFNTLQSSVGLSESLEYEKQTTSNYIADATSFADADKKLDDAIKAVDNKISEAGKVDKVQINGNDVVTNKIANIAVDGTYDDATNKIATVSTVTDAIANIAEATENDTDAGVKVEVKTAAGSVSSVDVAVTAATVTYTPKADATEESEATDINLTASDTTSVLNGSSIEQIKAYIDAMVAAKVAQVTNSGATIPVNNATATKIAEVDGTAINAKVSLVWDEYE